MDRLDKYDLISFDVFDTLIFRRTDKPADVFRVLEKNTGISGFCNMRIKAEATVRDRMKSIGREVCISDIYEELSKYCKLDKKKAEEDEIKSEMMCCYANKELLKVCRMLHEKGKRIIAISDMYLSESVICELLKKNGFEMIDAVYVSCDRNAGKTDGKLYKVVSASEGNPEMCIHIGDNITADVIGGKKSGWDTLRYQKR